MAVTDAPAVAAARPALSRNLAVQGLRGVAALAVVLFHTHRWFPEAGAWPFDERFGMLGVAVFFAISGMLMAELMSRTEPWRFLSHRVVRIYPLYLLLVATWAIVAQALGVQRVGFHLLSLTLAPVGGRYYYLGPEWTLVYEVSYYVALFALAWAGLQRHLVPIACAWLVVIVLVPLVPGWNANAMPVGPGILFKVPSIAFAGGLLVPTIARHAPMGLSVLAVAPCFLFWPESVIAQYWVAGAAAIFVTLDVSRIRVSAPGLAKLGDWSYAFGVFARPQTRGGRRVACRLTGCFRDRRRLRNPRCVALCPLKERRRPLSRRSAPSLAALVLGGVLRCYGGCACGVARAR